MSENSIKLTLKEADELFDALSVFVNIKMPLKMALRAGTIHRDLAPRIQAFRILKLETIQKYGKEMEQPKGMWQVLPENGDAFAAEMEPSLSDEIEIPGAKKIDLNLDEVDIDVEGSVIAALSPILNVIDS